MIMSMGFTMQQAEKALRATQNDVQRAADWIFSHSSELDSVDEEMNEAAASSPESELTDGNTRMQIMIDFGIFIYFHTY